MAKLAQKRCAPCRGSTNALEDAERARVHTDLDQGEVERGHHLDRTFMFPDFAQALALMNLVGAVAVDQGYHPEVHLA